MKYEPFYVGPNGVGVAHDSDYDRGHNILRVVSSCCTDEIHWDMNAPATEGSYVWVCRKCRNYIRTGGGASVYYLRNEDEIPVAEWLAGWFGVPTEDIEVSIE